MPRKKNASQADESNTGAYYVSKPKGIGTTDELKNADADVVPGMKQSDILAAFKLFDKDGDGSISATELLSILTRSGTGNTMTEKDAKAIIKDFDGNGDGVLSLSEFTQALASDFRESVVSSEAYDTDMYNRRVEPHKAAIKKLFDRLDADGSGQLSMDEVKEVVSFYEGEAFDEATFLEWYDTNHKENVSQGGASGDSQIDLTEFGWYVATAAECDASKMAEVIDGISTAIDYKLGPK